jgi:CDP-glycerol glycerophosphotransferase (TagB/SpsB family)
LVARHAEIKLRERCERKEKIRVAFEVITASQFAGAELYQLFRKNPLFEVFVVVVPVSDLPAEERNRRVSLSVAHLREQGYDARSGIDSATGYYHSFEDWGGFPDIVFHSTPWIEAFPEGLSIESFPLRTLNILINYCVDVVDNPDGTYMEQFQFNKEIYNLVWRCYATDRFEMEGYHKYQFLRGENVKLSGYAKMDRMYQKKEYSEEEIRKIWKIPVGISSGEIKKVIIAPHFTIRDLGVIHFSTFHQNLYFFLYLADRYRDRICFVYKPHPSLRSSSVSGGLFRSVEEYDAYLEEWNKRENCRIVDESEYIDLFKTSDSMIMDSGSFLAEYLYVHKPLLYLRRPEQAFNPMGQAVVDTYYQAQGWDYSAIDSFLQEVVLNGEDPRKEGREKVFSEELDYFGKNGVLASEMIFEDILGLLSEEEKRSAE